MVVDIWTWFTGCGKSCKLRTAICWNVTPLLNEAPSAISFSYEAKILVFSLQNIIKFVCQTCAVLTAHIFWTAVTHVIKDIFLTDICGIYKTWNLIVISEAQIEIPCSLISSEWRWDVRMVPGWIIWFRFSVGLTFGWRKWNFFRLWYSMAEVCTLIWIMCEEATTHNRWYLRASPVQQLIACRERWLAWWCCVGQQEVTWRHYPDGEGESHCSQRRRRCR